MGFLARYKRYVQPTLISLFIFAIFAVSITAFTKYKIGLWKKDIRAAIADNVTGKKSALEKALYSRIFYTRGIAAYVSQNPDISSSEYASLAQEYIQGDSVINSMALSKDCILSEIYPLNGHEEALGLNLLEHPERKKMVEKTIETHLTFVAGPVELVEGGTAFISYTPIFDKTNPGTERFWGVADIVIKYNELINEAGLKENENSYKYALRGVNGAGNTGDAFWGDSIIFNQDPVTVSIDLPIGNWVLAAVPEKGWKQYIDQDRTLFLVLLFSSIIISILVWVVANSLAKIRRNEKELKAIFASLDSLVMELDSDGRYMKIVAINEEMLVQPKERLIGKSVHDILGKETADYFVESIRKCLKDKSLVVIEYHLEIGGEERWFSARISYKSDRSIIFNAYDITQAKKRERLLEESEKQLKELNASKDKFFSIIAHDLRSPLAGQKGLIDILVTEQNNLDEETKLDILTSLKQSSTELYNLLENLLRWAISQSGTLKSNPVKIDLKEKYDLVLKQFESRIHLKKIELVNDLNEDVSVFADEQLTDTIFRNLMSNAIKFTDHGGTVSVSTKVISKDSESFCQVNVKDTGVGIEPDVLAKLFTAGESRPTDGTNSEKGNGLGLLLCKEFVEIQGGEIWAESTPGEGSVFSFTLPLAN